MGANCLGGHSSELPESNKNPPLGYTDFVTVSINLREGVRYQCGADIQTIGQKLFQLERHRVDRRFWHSLGRFVGHFGAAVPTRGRAPYAPLVCAPSENLGRT